MKAEKAAVTALEVPEFAVCAGSHVSTNEDAARLRDKEKKSRALPDSLKPEDLMAGESGKATDHRDCANSVVKAAEYCTANSVVKAAEYCAKDSIVRVLLVSARKF